MAEPIAVQIAPAVAAIQPIQWLIRLNVLPSLMQSVAVVMANIVVPMAIRAVLVEQAVLRLELINLVLYRHHF
jgi:hypothetical protein